MYDPVAFMSGNLIVKEVDSNDLDTLLDLWSKPEVTRQAAHSRGMPGSTGDIEEWWRTYRMRRSDSVCERQFVIQIKNGPFIGESGWSRINTPDEIPEYPIEPRQTAILGDIKLDPDYRELGYEAEALKEILWWAFEEAGVDLIIVPAHADDENTKTAYAECGFSDTGTMAWGDFHVYAFKSGDWGG